MPELLNWNYFLLLIISVNLNKTSIIIYYLNKLIQTCTIKMINSCIYVYLYNKSHKLYSYCVSFSIDQMTFPLAFSTFSGGM